MTGSELEALKKDAARYRWLRSLPTKGNPPGLHVTLAVPMLPPNDWCVNSVNMADLDAAIDKAMSIDV